MARCQICGKTAVSGNTIQHKRGVAGKRWKKRAQKVKRMFMPNIQKKTLVVSGVEQSMKLCTKCIKKIRKDKTIKNFKNIAVA